jgi:hypothetical protein
MPVKIVHPNHIEIMGFGHVLLATPSVPTSAADLHMGQIAEEAALTSRAFAVIGKPTRDSSEAAEAQSQDQDLRIGIEGFLVEDGIRYVLEIEGKIEPGVEVVMAGGKTCSDSTLELVKSRLEKAFAVTSGDMQGDSQPIGLAAGFTRRDAKGEFLVETLRVMFGSEERQFSKEKVISVISEIADLLNGRVRPSLTD